MIDHSKLTIEIVEIEPVAVYEGTVYTRTIVGRLQNGTQIKIFDGITIGGENSVDIEDENIGDVLDVSISLLLHNDVKNVSDKTVGIYPPTKSSSEWSYDFVGKIIDIDPNTSSVHLDIGNGEIFVKLNDGIFQSLCDTDTAPSDYLYLPAVRVDFEGIIE